MVVYAESSAILAWLFNEVAAPGVVAALNAASLVVTSRLTAVECARSIHRARALSWIAPSQATALLKDFADASAQWDQLELGDQVLAAASSSFPKEPVRALDAVHIASAVIAARAWPGLSVLSLDARMRSNVSALGIATLPAVIPWMP